MESVSLHYNCSPEQDPASTEAGAPYRPAEGVSVSVSRSINGDMIVLDELVDEISAFITNAGWVLPDGEALMVGDRLRLKIMEEDHDDMKGAILEALELIDSVNVPNGTTRKIQSILGWVA